MSPNELAALVRDVNTDIARMARARQTQEEVREEIAYRANSPYEEQFIDADSFDQPLGEPRSYSVGGVEIKVWKTHRAGLRAKDIKGADLYYEITGRKFVLVQYKMPNRNGKIRKDGAQLSELIAACPFPCPPSDRFNCGAWYAVRDPIAATYMPACEAGRVFGRYQSCDTAAFVNGLTKERFQYDFSTCRIGARTAPVEIPDYQEASLAQDHLFIRVQQVGQEPTRQGVR